MQLGMFGWGLMLGPVIVALAPQFGADVVTTFAAVVMSGFMLGFAGYMRSKRPWWDAGRRDITLAERLERIRRVWCKITGRHIYQRKARGVRQCALCGWGDVDMAALAAYKVEREG